MRFHYIARGIFYNNGKVLIAHQKGADNTFLPGGHIEMGEKAETALLREITEEIGEKATIKQFIGAVEAMFIENGQVHHEINLLFEVDIPSLDSSISPMSNEPHLEFVWSKPEDLKAHNLLPHPLIDCLMDGEAEYHAYWGSSFQDFSDGN